MFVAIFCVSGTKGFPDKSSTPGPMSTLPVPIPEPKPGPPHLFHLRFLHSPQLVLLYHHSLPISKEISAGLHHTCGFHRIRRSIDKCFEIHLFTKYHSVLYDLSTYIHLFYFTMKIISTFFNLIHVNLEFQFVVQLLLLNACQQD